MYLLLQTRIPYKKWSSPQSAKESEIQYWGAISKMTVWSWFVSKETIQHHSKASLCPSHWWWRLVWPKSNPLWLYTGGDKSIQGIRSDRVPEELWTEVYKTVQETVTKTIPKKKKCKKAKWLSEDVLKIAEERREVKGKAERKRYTQLNAEYQRIARRDEKDYLSNEKKTQTNKNRKIIERERLKISSRKLEIREYFKQRWAW